MPTDLGIFREYAVLQEELFVLVKTMNGPSVKPLYSFIEFLAPERRPDLYDGEDLAVTGDCTGETDPPYVKVKKI